MVAHTDAIFYREGHENHFPVLPTQLILLPKIGNKKGLAIDLKPLADPSEPIRFLHPAGEVTQHSVRNRLEARRHK
jgi:hypothetical protein